MYSNENKILDVIFLGVAEEHGRKGLGSRLAKVYQDLSVTTAISRNVVLQKHKTFNSECARDDDNLLFMV